MSEPADQTDATEIFRKSMVDALAHLDAVTEDARKAHEKAIDDQIAAKEEYRRIEREAHQISEAYIEKHRKEIEERIRNEELFKITKNMIRDGRSAIEIYRWLEIPEKMMVDAWTELGFEPLGDHVANVSYVDQGKTGDVIFYRDDIVLRFQREFSGGLTLATIEIPSEESWLADTGLPLEERIPILEFIGQRIIRDQAAGYKYIIKEDSIVITL
ncbi:MAG TPA: hypothetical protein VMZ69_04745 [Saprospiraceae bacterium]|nr:hypothetical protein [Saprospiraceae bacterium]